MIGRILSVCLLAMICFGISAHAEENIPIIPPAVEQPTITAEPVEWSYVTRDGDSATYLAMDTISRQTVDDRLVFYGDVKKIYTRSGLIQVYYALKSDCIQDEESLALLKQIDHSIAHVSYCNTSTALNYRLHRVTFYNRSGNPIQTLDFDDMARQTDTDIEWQPVSDQMREERAVFYRLTNG